MDTAHVSASQAAFAHRDPIDVGHFELVNHGESADFSTVWAAVRDESARVVSAFGAENDHARREGNWVNMVLVTGFEPFGGESRNPSAEVALALDGRVIAGSSVMGQVLPCVFGLALRHLRNSVRRFRPELVICLGQAGGRSCLSLERVAINVDDARIPDNAGAAPVDETIASNGPVAYWSTLPIKRIMATLREAGLMVDISQTAGTFVCNHVFYGLMRTLARSGGRGGFIHIPYARGQGEPCMEIEDMVRGIALAIEVSLLTTGDVRLSGGATS